ncbi:MAG: cobalamin biosynthesis protein CbiD [Nitrospirae bacterium]|nr:MAG: cobalamin biosynthesis protein CbiD [Nitrospirota bacterium]
MKKKLRTGYTRGACAASAAAAAIRACLEGVPPQRVEIPFPDGSRHVFTVHRAELLQDGARASVIKDAGDDPDVTHGAEIIAEVRLLSDKKGILIMGGQGVGRVTKPGLIVPVGEHAINPVPKRMIEEAVREVVSDEGPSVEIIISVADGEKIAKRTINERLGIIGGLSILGTTGIVKPLSSEAWTATITATMNVARAVGLQEVVLCAGRASEEAHMRRFQLPEEAYVMMGDYLEFSLVEARRHGFKLIHLSAQWAKMLKCALSEEHLGKVKDPSGYTTHVRHGPLDISKAMVLLSELGLPEGVLQRDFNTAREVFELIRQLPQAAQVFKALCVKTSKVLEKLTGGIPVNACLVGYDKKIISTTYDTLYDRKSEVRNRKSDYF